jgi:ribosome recycling factor
MNEDAQFCLEEAKEKMENAIVHLEKEFLKIRAGKASPQMLDSVKVEYYEKLVPISQVSNINTPDPKTIVVQPWEKTMLVVIEKAIMAANLGFNPKNDGTLIRIVVPPLTEERRKDLVKKSKAEAENTKISIRTFRKDANTTGKQLEKDGVPEDDIKKLEIEIQHLTNSYIEKVDKLLILKEKDIMTI